ncbi:hypothetical protein [Pseudomonas beijingensis]|uniref:hypothetical protein n=1 Tax=Pseudomonas beijingensis TaxID=2954101 RepID=UPI0027343F28|nr:hypothetical protein [Pseudomonas sp. FP2262]WLH47766.1 hypothetical protein PSH83_07550 [Pseudomonas sp. FP2262]
MLESKVDNSKVDFIELFRVVGDLSGMVDFKKDLPTNVFIGNGFVFWFFERPLLDFVNVFSGLVSESLSSFGGDVFVKFSGEEFLVDSCFAINGDSVGADASWISDNFEVFLVVGLVIQWFCLMGHVTGSLLKVYVRSLA